MEVQVDYTMQLIKPILAGKLDAVNVKADATAEYNSNIQAKLKNTVWTGCYSCKPTVPSPFSPCPSSDDVCCRIDYNLQGQKNIAMYPGTLWSFWRSLSKPIWDHYDLATARVSKKVD